VFLSLLCALPALATDAPSAELFRRGRAAMKSGDCRAAVPLLSQSHSLDPAVGTALNLALCEEQLGELSDALEHLQFVIDSAGAEDPRRRFAERRVTEIERRMAWLSVAVPRSARVGLQVLLDGAPLAARAGSDPVRVDPGLHELTLRDTMHVLFQERLDLREGERRVWAPVLPPGDTTAHAGQDATAERRPRKPRPAPQRRPAEHEGPPTLGYVGVGVGTAAIAASVVLGLLVLEKKDEISHCDADGGCDQKGVDAAKAGKTLSTLSTISAAVGLPVLALGGYLLLSYDPAGPRDHAPAAAHLRFILPTN
jgi:hypothetical protein